MLTISRLTRFGIAYYNDTADQAKQATLDRQKANGGLGEYYSEGETRTPTWLVIGDTQSIGDTTGLTEGALHGGEADTETARLWLDDGRAPSGAHGRAFTDTSVHGFDLTFAAPKSVSLIRALTDDIAEKVLAGAHTQAIEAAMAYLHQHAGYTRVHNPITGRKDLQRLPGLVAIAYQHETSRCGDPHLHTHVIVPNRQPRADGQLVALDSKSLYHEAKAAGMIYQATLRHILHAERGFEWQPVDPHTGMAEIAGVPTETITAWSQRSTRLREWARDNLVLVDGQPTAAQLAAAQKATRPPKPESLAWAALKQHWRQDERGLRLDRDAHYAARAARRAAHRTTVLDRTRTARMAAQIDKAAFTRADLVELIGAQLPVDAAGEPRELIERAVDAVSVRISETRAAHQREGHERFTVEAIIAEEERVFDMIDASDTAARLNLRATDLHDLSAAQQRALRAIAISPFLVQPLQAPAGAGKTHSLRALRAAAHRARKDVLVLAPTGKAVDEAIAEGAGDRGLTVAKALHLIAANQLTLDRATLVVVDEASMLGTPELANLLSAAVAGRAKMVFVGDAHQLAPVKARGGMFEQLCTELPWSQHLSEVWRMRDPVERDMSLALRSAHGHRLRAAVKWYRTHGRLHTGDPIAMAADALDAYRTDRDNNKDALLICDTWEMADALNRRLHDTLTTEGPSVKAARDHHIRVGDLIISRANDATIQVRPNPNRTANGVDQVRNGNRWRVAAVDPATNRLAAERLTDGARTVLGGDYLTEHVTLGYATTVHAAQGVTADSCHALLGEGASRAMLYVAMTRGREDNQAYLYQKLSHEADHDHGAPVAAPQLHQLHRGDKYSAARAFRIILTNDDRPTTMHAHAEHTAAEMLPDMVADALQRNQHRRRERQTTWKEHNRTAEGWRTGYERMAAAEQTRSAGIALDGSGLEL